MYPPICSQSRSEERALTKAKADLSRLPLKQSLGESKVDRRIFSVDILGFDRVRDVTERGWQDGRLHENLSRNICPAPGTQFARRRAAVKKVACKAWDGGSLALHWRVPFLEPSGTANELRDWVPAAHDL